MWRTVLFVGALVAGASSGCGGGEGTPDARASSRDADGARDAAPLDDADIDAALVPGEDAGLDARITSDDAGLLDDDAAAVFDATTVSSDAAAGSDDAFTPLDAFASADAFVHDAGADAARPDLGPVQCSAALDCPGGAGLCNDTAPGGVCSCFAGADCPTGTTCDTDFGACVRDCTSDLDCSAGMSCAAGTGRCQIRRCSDTTACPAPYVCTSPTSGICRRPSCAGGASCPSTMHCVSDVCVEG